MYLDNSTLVCIFLINYFNLQWTCLYCSKRFRSDQKISRAHTNYIKKESELDWEFDGGTNQCNRILGELIVPIHFITESLSSALDPGAHDVLLFSVIGYHYRGYTTGVTVVWGLQNRLDLLESE